MTFPTPPTPNVLLTVLEAINDFDHYPKGMRNSPRLSPIRVAIHRLGADRVGAAEQVDRALSELHRIGWVERRLPSIHPGLTVAGRCALASIHRNEVGPPPTTWQQLATGLALYKEAVPGPVIHCLGSGNVLCTALHTAYDYPSTFIADFLTDQSLTKVEGRTWAAPDHRPNMAYTEWCWNELPKLMELLLENQP